MKEKTLEIFNLLKDNEGTMSIDAMKEATGRTGNSIGGSLLNLTKLGLAQRYEEDGVKCVALTDEGLTFDPSTDEEA